MELWYTVYMEMILQTPTKLILPSDDDSVRKFLTFQDRSVDYQIQKLNKNLRWKNQNPESYFERLDELKASRQRCILFQDEDGTSWTFSGLWQDLQQRFGWTLQSTSKDIKNLSIPWTSTPHELRYYQREATEALIKARHAAVELPTASGKTRIIMELLKQTSTQSLIVTPSSAITEQIYDELVKFFGSRYVGQYGNGKKQFNKLFTVATLQALLRLEPSSVVYDTLSTSQVFIGDEAHCLPPDAFQSVCTGVAAHAPYRFFLSATQLRTDGSAMVLRGITGPIVYKKEYQELAEEGYVARMVFKTFSVPSYGASSDDPNKETRKQLYCNPNVNRMAADIASKSVLLANRQTVIVVDEFKQFLQLKNYLTVPFEFVHGGASKDVKDVLPQEYWKCDTKAIVERFNKGEVKLLIGTSAISTGVDLRPVGCLIYLQGDASEIKVRQALGRGSRLAPGKTDCWCVDFNVTGSRTMERHFLARKKIYETMGIVEHHG